MDALREFRRLFWAARKAHVKAGKKATDQCPEHKAALAFAQAHGLQWAESLLDASFMICQGKHDDRYPCCAPYKRQSLHLTWALSGF